MGSLGVAQKSAQAQSERTYSKNPHGAISIPCENCHTSTGWKPIRSVPEFDHNRTRYPLRGMHEKVQCTLCHTNLVFTNVSTRCADCHADIHRGQFGSDCERCHTVKGWDIKTDQVRQHTNRFPLFGAHATLECADCHKGEAVGQFTGLQTTCISCHTADYQQALNPDHKALNFPSTCETCHSADTWFDAKFDHLKFTGFALTGAHATLPCTDCHIGGKFQGTPADCYGCHAKDFNATMNPPHAQAGFSQQCQTCHNTTAWIPATFDHSKTVFPLTGAHVSVACNLCHINGQFANTPTDCYSCHTKDYNGTTNPNHAQSGISQQCQGCHNTSAWIPATFDHSKTVFPLTGAHATVACNLCHINGQFANTPTDCYSCHVNDFNGTTSPNHVQTGMPHQCQVCHNTTAWQPATFDHSTTSFPLTGAHTTVPCGTCHTDNYAGTLPTTCYGCHQKDFTGTANIAGVPNHVNAGFSQDCTQCHTTTTWLNATFNHNATSFPLTGAHTSVACATCHTDNYAGTLPTTCYGCHQKDFTNTATISGVPNHVTANFPQDCTLCHTTTTWLNATFNHNTTSFPLTGAHTTVPCATCHTDNYAGTLPTTCIGCHQKDYNNTATITGVPNHVTLGYPQDCTMCHTTATWLNATFNHNSTPFPLTGFHVTVPCNSCHIGGVFAGTPTDCYSCHKADYAGTTNPNHAAAGFPTTCATCHTTTSWAGATFNHTWFPMNHGNANGVCSTCHTNPNDYSVFQCTNCHTAAQTNPRHSGVSGYVYNSINCYQCHKSGGGG
ncbi:MAG TPA: hypothetical protein VN822_14510 [Candidatus Acidoferrales bacterium]|nr:hypothetical protein [Candidatus Acidoferrales bacterium]